MALKDASLNGVRADIIRSIVGRRLGLDKNDMLLGQAGEREGVEGFSSIGSSTPSTAVATTLAIGGITVGGSVASSGTTAASPACAQLPAPMPGVWKTIFNMTTAMYTVGTTGSAAFFMSTGSAGSTYQYATLWGKGASLQLIGLTTAFWGVVGNPQTTVSTNVSFI